MGEKGADETVGKDAGGPGGVGAEEHRRQLLALRGAAETSKCDKDDPILFAAFKHVASNLEQSRKLNTAWIKNSKYTGKHLVQSIVIQQSSLALVG